MKYKLSEIMYLIGGGTPKTSVETFWNGDIPWLSVKDFNNDYNADFNQNLKTRYISIKCSNNDYNKDFSI